MNYRIDYIFDKFPRWIEYSGLPSLLNKKIGFCAWPILKKLIELDCRYNPNQPDWYDVSQEELSMMLGSSIRTIQRYLRLLKSAGGIDYRPGKYKQGKGSIRIKTLPVEKLPEEINAIHGGSFGKTGRPFKARYAYQRVTGSHAFPWPKGDNQSCFPGAQRVTSSPESMTSSPESMTSSHNKDTDKETIKDTDKEIDKKIVSNRADNEDVARKIAILEKLGIVMEAKRV